MGVLGKVSGFIRWVYHVIEKFLGLIYKLLVLFLIFIQPYISFLLNRLWDFTTYMVRGTKKRLKALYSYFSTNFWLAIKDFRKGRKERKTHEKVSEEKALYGSKQI